MIANQARVSFKPLEDQPHPVDDVTVPGFVPLARLYSGPMVFVEEVQD
jgi:hypothetical protein